MRTIRWGILGCGDVTEVKSGPALQKATNSALVAVMRRDGARAADFARRHGVPRWYDDADALIFDPEVDAVYVATPPSSHLALATRVAAAGKPCYVEKPMAMNAAECRAMIAAFEAADVPLFVAYYRRALPAFVRARELVTSGALGTITGVSHRIAMPSHRNQKGWRFDPAIAGGGLVVDLGSHALNALDWIAGPFRDVVGHAGNVAGGSVEDVASYAWRHEGGAIGSAHFNFASGAREDVMEVSGTEGRVRWACFDNAGVVTIDRGDGNVTTEHHPVPAHVHQPLVQTIVDELNGVGRCPSDAAAGLRTAAALDVALAPFYASRAEDAGSMADPTTQRKSDYDIIEPVGRRIVVRKDENKRVTRAGIALPDTHEIPVITGRVIAISRELANDDDVALKAYDRILFDPREAIPVDLEHDNRQFVVHVDRVLAIFRRAGDANFNNGDDDE